MQVTDDDGLRVVPRTTTVGEGSSTGATYTVALKSQPSGAVTVSVGVPSGDASAVSVAPTALTFTGGSGGNWGTAQTVTVSAGTGANDADAADRAVTLTHAVVAGSSADEYDAAAAVTLAVAVTDDEGAEIVVSRGAGELGLMESTGTTSATYTVRLSVQPTGPVTVGVSSDRRGGGDGGAGDAGVQHDELGDGADGDGGGGGGHGRDARAGDGDARGRGGECGRIPHDGRGAVHGTGDGRQRGAVGAAAGGDGDGRGDGAACR